jgi:hypothetical protein
MNQPDQQRQDLALIEGVLATFTQKTGLATAITANEPNMGDGRRADALITIRIDDQPMEFVVEAKNTLDRAVALVAAKERLAPYGERGLLVAPRITIELAAVARKMKLQFIDGAGNAFIDRRGAYLFVQGERPDVPFPPAGKGGTATHLRIVFALLCQPERIDAPYRDIAQAAGVALGAVGGAFQDLNARGFATGGTKAGKRRLLERRRLLEEWITNYPIKLRPKLNPQIFRAHDAAWWKNAKLAGTGAYWGGEVAANKLTRQLRPARCILYVDPMKRRETTKALVVQNRLMLDPAGEVEILDAFWNLPGNAQHGDIVPTILVYADLVATLDPRNIEVANILRHKFITHAVDAT